MNPEETIAWQNKLDARYKQLMVERWEDTIEPRRLLGDANLQLFADFMDKLMETPGFDSFSTCIARLGPAAIPTAEFYMGTLRLAFQVGAIAALDREMPI